MKNDIKKVLIMNLIKRFTIKGLFGTNDVSIPFDDNVKILIGENGIGKTQVLNLFYYTLERNFFRLREFNFKELILEFSNETFSITKKQIEELTNELYKDPFIKGFIDAFGYSEFEYIKNKFSKYKVADLEFEIEMGKIYDSYKDKKYPVSRIFSLIEIIRSKTNSFTKYNISSNISGYDLMYFPTYRRVEEDLHNLGYNDENLNLDEENTVIQFGMDDVQRRFKSIENTIDRQLKEGLAQFTKDILNVVIDDIEPKNEIFEKINEEDIDLILSRIGNQLPQQQKDSVKNIIVNKQYKNPLSAYLLQKLIDIYEKQKEIDTSIKVFRDVCNKYLINKKIFYDESSIKIYVKSNFTGKEIELSKLSSGEKQIISIFSKIYLSDKGKRFIILFDEPELSLSMIWQKQLLPDIINSKKCDFLLAVTHSPFIFDNELDSFAVGLNEYVTGSSESFNLGSD